MTQNWEDLILEEESFSLGICECCQNETASVTGFLYDKFDNWVAYNVCYTKGVPDHGAEFTLITGQWGEGSSPNDRYVIVLDYYPNSGFMVAENCFERKGQIVSAATNFVDRDGVIGTDFASTLFMIVDAVYMKETRLNEIRNWKTHA